MSSIPENIRNIRHQITVFEQKYARSQHSVLLLAVSKTQSTEKILQAHASGQNDFGENYLQEALDKITALHSKLITWHFIGPIQSNKTKAIATHFNWVHSVDRYKIALRLNEQRPPELPPLNILLQVNLSNEPSKSGISIDHLSELAKQVSKLRALKLCGLMAIPAPCDNFEQQKTTFLKLTEARDALIKKGFTDCQHLSMGMSKDYEAAIAAGASIIRVGTDIFGSRLKPED